MRSPSTRQLRESGIVVGCALVGCSIWLWRREWAIAAAALCGAGTLSAALGAIRPQLLATPHRIWMTLATALGWISTRLILAFVFFFLLTPLGALRRLLGADPFGRGDGSSSTYWIPYPERHANRVHYERMY